MSENQESQKAVKPSRADVETLCLLEAIGSERRTPTEVSARLGWMPDMADAASRAVEKVVTLEYVAVLRDDSATTSGSGVRYFVTDAGRTFLDAKLRQYGVHPAAGA